MMIVHEAAKPTNTSVDKGCDADGRDMSQHVMGQGRGGIRTHDGLRQRICNPPPWSTRAHGQVDFQHPILARFLLSRRA